jgi:membrane-associated phospholipid phosphatase
MNLKKFIVGIPLAIILIMCCYHFFDVKIALFVKRVLMSGEQPSLFSADIPDFLPLFVCIITALALVLYIHDKRKGIDDIRTAFFLLVGTSLPMTFLIKSILKFVFGGITTRFWLVSPVARDFHWFHGADNYSGFPSGHMAVFTAIFLDSWKYYPRYRSVYGALLFLLAMALISTNYHFLSDIVAGAYLGYVIYYFSDHGLKLLHKSRAAIDKG